MRIMLWVGVAVVECIVQVSTNLVHLDNVLVSITDLFANVLMHANKALVYMYMCMYMCMYMYNMYIHVLSSSRNG